jgi:heptose-I-phosphate ethanolaminephosphotransferase
MSRRSGTKRLNVCAILALLKEKLLFPFKQDWFYFLLLWVLIALPNCYSQLGHPTYAVYLAMMYYIITYIIVVVLNLFQKIARVLKPIVFILTTLLSILNLYCYHVYGCLLSNDFIQIVAATNPDEAKEYFDTFISWEQVALFFSIIVLSIVIAILLPKIQKVSWGKLWIVAGGMLLISICAIWRNSGIIQEEFVDKERWTFNFEEVVDLKNHPTHPQIEECDSIHPSRIIIILGESFSLNHSSLYGYKRNTNPLLKKQVEDGNLFVYKQVTSPCSHTTAAFKYLLNTYQIGHEDGFPWYEHTNIIEVMKIAGYYTAWISNQSEKGMFDNLPSGHAQLCDEKFFLENEKKSDRCDGGLIGKESAKTRGKNVVFYHFMGQHEKFEERYPHDYEQFNGKDYEECPEHQRKILAAYDNATLYNDFVVNSIMDRYKEQDAVVFYFSDHGLDLFDTDPNYFGHAKATEESQAQGKKIPFMIYVSPVFQELHPDKIEKMKSAMNKLFCTDKFIYAVMDVAGYRFVNNNDVEKYSIFQ